MPLPPQSAVINTVPSYTNMGVFCTFIDDNNNDYEHLSLYVYKLSNDHIEFYFNIDENEILLMDDIFNAMSNNVTMIVNYYSPSTPDKVIAELWFEGFNFTSISNLFEYDNMEVINPPNDHMRVVKMTFEYKSIQYMKTDLKSVRLSKINKLKKIDDNVQLIERNKIKDK